MRVTYIVHRRKNWTKIGLYLVGAAGDGDDDDVCGVDSKHSD